MTSLPTGSELLRPLGLLLDGPARWGQQVGTNRPGVFLIEFPAAAASPPIDLLRVRDWIERVPDLRLDGARPAAKDLADRIASYWVPGSPVVFIGSTTGSLGARVRAIQQTKLGDPRPYSGAHWVLTLRDQETLRVWWAETDAGQEYEDGLLDAFAAAVPAQARIAAREPELILPFAVLRRPTGQRRRHGISGALLSERSGQPSAAPVVRRASSRGAGSVAVKERAPRRAAKPSTARSEAAAVGLSAEGMEAVQSELRELRGVRRPATVKRVATAREHGDLRENAEYQTSRQELGFIDGRIEQLEARLRHAVQVERPTTGIAALGSTLIVTNGEATIEFRLVHSSEADPAAGRISTSSPVGKALVGSTTGDEVVVVTPGGRQIFRVVGVS